MITLKMPYGDGAIEVADDAAGFYRARGWIVTGESPEPGPASPPPIPPPKSGPGSGAAAWQQYALDLGLAWASDSAATREEMIERVAAAGFPVDRSPS